MADGTLAEVGTLPGHVPQHLVVDFDIYAPQRPGEEFFAAWCRFQNEAPGPVVWTPRNGGHWIAVRGDGVMAVYEDSTRFSSDSFGVPIAEGEQRPLGALLVDPPEHRFYRGFLNLGLAPKIVRANEPAIRERAVALIDGFRPRGSCEVVRDFADVLPLSVFLELVDLPLEDREMLSGWTAETVRGVDAVAREGAFQQLADYLRPVLDRRRGGDAADMLTQIANLDVAGRQLTAHEATGAAIHLVMAGLDTVASLLVFVLRFLAEHPAERRRLIADPALIEPAATEFLRRFPIVTMSRRVQDDLEFAGVALRRDDMISAASMLYNLDPAVYPDPLSFDPSRRPGKIATFGNGPHRCPGAILGRTELIVTLQEWLHRIPDFAIAPDGAGRVSGGIVASMDRLDLIWRPGA